MMNCWKQTEMTDFVSLMTRLMKTNKTNSMMTKNYSQMILSWTIGSMMMTVTHWMKIRTPMSWKMSSLTISFATHCSMTETDSTMNFASCWTQTMNSVTRNLTTQTGFRKKTTTLSWN